MRFPVEIARAIEAESNRILDALAAAISAEFDLPAQEVRATIVERVRPAIDEILVEYATAANPGGPS